MVWSQLLGVADSGQARSAQDAQGQVAASFGPLVVLLGQDRADQADDAGAVGEDPVGVGARRGSQTLEPAAP